MEYSLWRGKSLIGQVLVTRRNDSHTISGQMEHTAALDELGPVMQQRVLRDSTVTLVQHMMPRAADVPFSFGSGEVELVEVAHTPGENTNSTSLVSPEHVLMLRDSESRVIATDMIWIVEPPSVPAEFTAELVASDPSMLEHFRKWRVLCRLSDSSSDAA